jgi:predicted RNA methylase
MEEIFLQKEGVDYTQLKLTEEGLYSVTRRKDAERAVSLMKSTIGDLKTRSITDATGCVGGDTIHFANEFQFVHSIEMNEDNFKVLQNNVEQYKFENIALHHGDATKLFNWKSDVLYIDPPWGGPQYKEQKVLDLVMSDVRLDEWLEQILLRKNRPKYIFLKLPYNYNFIRLNFLSNVEHIKPYRIRGYVFVSIIVHRPKTNS